MRSTAPLLGLLVPGLLIPGLLAPPPAAAAEILVDWDKGADLSSYSTYAWLVGPDTPGPEIQGRIRKVLEAELAGKGLTPADGEPDLYLAVHASMDGETYLDVSAYGYAGGLRWAGWSAWGPTTVNVRRLRAGTLVVDLVDGASRELVWRGIARDTLVPKPEKTEKKLIKVAAKMFQGFPPAAGE